jgi:non-heme chloroperoxidase
MRPALLVASICALAASRGLTAQPHNPGAARSHLVRLDSNVSLEVVDWGGAGPPLVFLAGGGNTAHVFDGFAPRFTGRFHVLGITRRGFGASAGQLPASDLDTLVTDITRVLDELSLRRVIFVGHSIAGEEMTRFAELRPKRCAGLVYIDAAYDRTGIDTMAKHQPPTPSPRISSSDTASYASVEALYARLLGVRMPESEIRAGVLFDEHDRFVRVTSTMARQARLASGARKARYERVRCAALAIYAVADSAVDVVPYLAELDSEGRAQARALLRFVQANVEGSRRKFARMPERTVVNVRGNHYVFLQHPEEVARAMQAFLSRILSRSPRD